MHGDSFAKTIPVLVGPLRHCRRLQRSFVATRGRKEEGKGDRSHQCDRVSVIGPLGRREGIQSSVALRCQIIRLTESDLQFS